MTQPDPHHTVSFHKPTAELPAPPAWASPPPATWPAVTGPAPVAPPQWAGSAVQPSMPPVHYATAQTVVVQQSNVEIIVAWVVTGLTLLYMLPWAVAATRRSTNSVLIAIATFFLAWTVIGWLALLVLSFLGPTVRTVSTVTSARIYPPPPAPGVWAHHPADPPHVQRWHDGVAWTGHTTSR